MEMIEVKTAELIGPALRYAVAVATGFKLKRLEEGDYAEGEPHWWMVYDQARVTDSKNGMVGYIQPRTSCYSYHPDKSWSQGGPLIEKYKVRFDYRIADFGLVMASACGLLYDHAYKGCDSYLVAACRAIVHAKLGYTVSVPKELMQ